MEIKRIQVYLKALSFYKGKIDGIKGVKTINAIISFQKKYKLKADGIVGKNTKKMLIKKYNLYLKNKKVSKKAKYSFQKNNGEINWDKVKNLGFKKSEFKCHCKGKYCNGYPSKISPDLVYVVIKLRKKYNKPVYITSGLRCKKWNRLQAGSSSTSKHMSGKAVDFYIPNLTNSNSKRNKIKSYLYSIKKVKYVYHGTKNMSNAIHVNV